MAENSTFELCENLGCAPSFNGNLQKHPAVQGLCQSVQCVDVIRENLSQCVSNGDPTSWASFSILNIVTAVVILLDFKIPMLRSPSRIVRKLRRQRELGLPMPTQHEAQLHIALAKMGKGRHALASRVFIPILDVWWFVINVIGYIADEIDSPLGSHLTTFDPLLAFRLKILLSCVTVLGAWPKSRGIIQGAFGFLSFAFIAAVNALHYFLVSLRFIHVSEDGRKFAIAISFVLTIGLFILNIWEEFGDTHVVDVCVHRLRRRNGTIEAGSKYASRYADIERQVIRNSHLRYLTWRQYLRIALSTLLFFAEPYSYKPYTWIEPETRVRKTLCRELVTDMTIAFLEVLYTCMALVQDIEVEPELFRLLVKQEM